MSTARAVAESIADRILDEDAAIALAAAPPDLADSILEVLHDAAGRDGVTDDEALAFAQQAASLALRAWLDSEAGRRALLAAIAAVERDKGHRGISAATVRTVERITGTRVAARLAERGSPRAEGDDAGPSGTTGPDARKAGGGT